jgi:hypothetical protein
VAPADLAVLAARLRPCLPTRAGPANASALEAPGAEVSGFLRCYLYRTGDASAPHYDRSFREHEVRPKALRTSTSCHTCVDL